MKKVIVTAYAVNSNNLLPNGGEPFFEFGGRRSERFPAIRPLRARHRQRLSVDPAMVRVRQRRRLCKRCRHHILGKLDLKIMRLPGPPCHYFQHALIHSRDLPHPLGREVAGLIVKGKPKRASVFIHIRLDGEREVSVFVAGGVHDVTAERAQAQIDVKVSKVEDSIKKVSAAIAFLQFSHRVAPMWKQLALSDKSATAQVSKCPRRQVEAKRY